MGDKDDVYFSPSEARCLQIMLEKEQSVYRKSCIHLKEGSDITTKDRAKIIDWCYRAVECLRFDSELVEEVSTQLSGYTEDLLELSLILLACFRR